MGSRHRVHIQRQRAQRDPPGSRSVSPDDGPLWQRQPDLRADKLYVSTNILDSGDAHWYWQFYQRQIWADPVRGTVPTGYGKNVTLQDALPLVAQWYYEHRCPRFVLRHDVHERAGLREPVAEEDRERIWREYVARLDAYRRQLDMQGVELYSGGNSGPSATTDVLRRFTRNMPGLEYILTDLGRHIDTTPGRRFTDARRRGCVPHADKLPHLDHVGGSASPDHGRRKRLAPAGDHVARPRPPLDFMTRWQ